MPKVPERNQRKGFAKQRWISYKDKLDQDCFYKKLILFLIPHGITPKKKQFLKKDQKDR